MGAEDYFEAEKLLIDVEKELDQMENSDARGSDVSTISGATLNNELSHLLQSIEVNEKKYSLYIRLYSNRALVNRDRDFNKATESFDNAKRKEAERTAYLQHCKGEMKLPDDIMKALEDILVADANTSLIV